MFKRSVRVGFLSLAAVAILCGPSAQGSAEVLSVVDGQLVEDFGADAQGKTIVWWDVAGDFADGATAAVVDPTTGSIFVGGTVNWNDGGTTTSGTGMVKLHPNGTIDGSFASADSGKLRRLYPGRNMESQMVALDTGGPRVVGGSFPTGAGDAEIFHQVIDPTGSSTGAFYRNLPLPSGPPAEPFLAAASADALDRRLVCGTTDLSGDSFGFVGRLDSVGNWDPSFGSMGLGWGTLWVIDPSQGANWCNAVRTDRQGRILTVARGLNYSTLQSFAAVQRWNADFTAPDATFGASGTVLINLRPDQQFETMTDLVVADTGEIFVVGFAQGPVSSSMAATLAQISPNGSTVIPSEFYASPIPPHTYTRWELQRAVIDPAGRLVVGGTLIKGPSPLEHQMTAVRFSEPFTLDSTFGSGGFSFVSFTDVPSFSRERADLEDLLVTPDGRFLLIGRALYGASGDNYDFAVAKLDNAAIFFGGFEVGDTDRWSEALP